MGLTKVKNVVSGLTSDGVTYNQGGTDSTLRSLSDKLGESVSIEDFGASPTETGANNALYIQAALDTGIDVFVPAGIYEVSDTLTMNTYYQSLFGAGSFSELRFVMGSSLPGLIMGVPTGVTSCAHQQLRNIYLHGHTNVSTTLQLKGPMLQIVGNKILNATASGTCIDLINEDPGAGIYCFGQRIIRNQISATRASGVVAVRLGNNHQGTVISKNIITDAATLIHVDGTTTNTIITGNIIEGTTSTDAAILVSGSSGSTPIYSLKIQNNYFEETRFPVSITAGKFANMNISGNYASRNLGNKAGSSFFTNTVGSASAASDNFTVSDNYVLDYETFLTLNDQYSSRIYECGNNTLDGVTNYSTGTYAKNAYKIRVINNYYVRKLVSGSFVSEDNQTVAAKLAVFEVPVPIASGEYLDKITFDYFQSGGTGVTVELRSIINSTDALVATVTVNTTVNNNTLSMNARAQPGYNYYLKATFDNTGTAGYVYPFQVYVRA